MRLIWSFILILITNLLVGQTLLLKERLVNTVQKKGQAIVEFHENKTAKLNQLSKIISIDWYRNGIVRAYISQRELETFLSEGYDFSIVEDKSPSYIEVAHNLSDMSDWDKYPSYEVYTEMMFNYADNYPEICKLDTIGYSQNNRLILTLKITDNPNEDEYEPEFLYTGQMHGDEMLTSVLFLRLINYILSNYETDTIVQNLVNNTEIWINPLSNPDGLYWGGNDNVSGSVRYLANGIDPNRNFPNPEGGEHPDGNEWAQETIDMMAFLESKDFVISANTHSGAEVVNYPWDTWDSNSKVTPDNDWWVMVSQEYAENAQNDSPPNYFTSVASSGYINGGDWYVVRGTRQDYMNYFLHCREATIELSNQKKLSSNELPDYWMYNKEALISYLQQVQYGIKGIVTDSCTGLAIRAKIEVLEHDQDNSFVYSSLPIGNFHRPIKAGTYALRVSAEGYYPKMIENISTDDYNTTEVNISLSPILPLANFSYEQSENFISFNNLSNYANIFEWDFGDGTTSNSQNPTHFYDAQGQYIVSLKAIKDSCGSDIYTDTINIQEVGIESIKKDDIKITPNPAHDNFRILKSQSVQRLEMIDIRGNIVLKKDLKEADEIIPIQNLKSGIYFLNIQTKQHQHIYQTLIKN